MTTPTTQKIKRPGYMKAVILDITNKAYERRVRWDTVNNRWGACAMINGQLRRIVLDSQMSASYRFDIYNLF